MEIMEIMEIMVQTKNVNLEIPLLPLKCLYGYRVDQDEPDT
jgi:hypothetical protein